MSAQWISREIYNFSYIKFKFAFIFIIHSHRPLTIGHQASFISNALLPNDVSESIIAWKISIAIFGNYDKNMAKRNEKAIPIHLKAKLINYEQLRRNFRQQLCCSLKHEKMKRKNNTFRRQDWSSNSIAIRFVLIDFQIIQ